MNYRELFHRLENESAQQLQQQPQPLTRSDFDPHDRAGTTMPSSNILGQRFNNNAMDVKEIQATLNRLGYRDNDGRKLVVDGIFGPRTAAAVRNFQRSVGIAVTGDVGPQTRGALSSRSSDFVGAGNTYKPDNRAQVSEESFARTSPMMPDNLRQSPLFAPITAAIPQFGAAPTPEERYSPRSNSGPLLGFGLTRNNRATLPSVRRPNIASYTPITSVATATNHQTPFFINTDGLGRGQAGVNAGWMSGGIGVSSGRSNDRSLSGNIGFGDNSLTITGGWDPNGSLFIEGLGNRTMSSTPYMVTSESAGGRFNVNPIAYATAGLAAAAFAPAIPAAGIGAGAATIIPRVIDFLRPWQPSF